MQANVVVTYQRLVKTTPNPRATKNSSGELVGPVLLLLLLLAVPGVAVGEAEVDSGVDIASEYSFSAFWLNRGHARSRTEWSNSMGRRWKKRCGEDHTKAIQASLPPRPLADLAATLAISKDESTLGVSSRLVVE